MAVIDLSGFGYFLPIFTFLLVFVLSYAFLLKAKIIDSAFANLLISFVVSIIFVGVSSARDLLVQVTPWFAVILVCMVFVVILAAASQQDVSKFFKPSMAWIAIGVLAIVIIIAVFKTFELHIDLVSLTSTKSGAMITLFVLTAVVAFILSLKLKK